MRLIRRVGDLIELVTKEDISNQCERPLFNIPVAEGVAANEVVAA